MKLHVVKKLKWEVLYHEGVGLKLQVVRTLRQEVLHYHIYMRAYMRPFCCTIRVQHRCYLFEGQITNVKLFQSLM